MLASHAAAAFSLLKTCDRPLQCAPCPRSGGRHLPGAATRRILLLMGQAFLPLLSVSARQAAGLANVQGQQEPRQPPCRALVTAASSSSRRLHAKPRTRLEGPFILPLQRRGDACPPRAHWGAPKSSKRSGWCGPEWCQRAGPGMRLHPPLCQSHREKYMTAEGGTVAGHSHKKPACPPRRGDAPAPRALPLQRGVCRW